MANNLFEIRNATHEQCVEIFDIETVVIKNGWSQKSIFELQENPLSTLRVVVNQDNKVVGYYGFYAICDECEILNVAVAPEFQGRGLGAMLIDDMTNEAKKRGLIRLTLEARESNIRAINLYKKFGFKIITKRKKYYDNTEDAVIMQKE